MNRKEKNLYNKEWMKDYRKTEKGEIANSKSCKKWRKNNPEKVKEIGKQWRKNNPDYKGMNSHKKDNPEKMRESRRKYNKTEKGKATNQRRHTNRRAKEKLLINTLTAGEWIDILLEYRFKCAYCGKEFTLFNKATRDHVIPIDKGGNNIKENIVPACQSCNSRKGAKLI